MKTNYYSYPNVVENKGAGLEVRIEQELLPEELDLLKQANLENIAPLEAWTALGSNAQINYSTHGIFRYFGKFPSTIATHLITTYTNENEYVMDPMGGSGTTALECLLLNRNCCSFDVNPLSILLAKVKTTHIDACDLNKQLEEICSSYKSMSIEDFDWTPQGLKDINHWFLPETQNSIRGLIYQIEKIDNKDIKDFFTICLVSSIRTVSRATSQQGRLFLDVLSAKQDCLETFSKKANKAIHAVNSLPLRKTNIEIGNHNASEPFYLQQLNDLIIIHPPYFNSYKYSSVNSLELSWMKIDHATVRKKEVREFFKVGKAENVNKYVDDMSITLNNIVSTLKPNGVMGMMIGDTSIKGQYIPVTKMVIDRLLVSNPALSIEKVVIRVPKYTEASWTTSQRRKSDKVGINLNDFIIIFRRSK